jgi:hypothetical protein
MFSRVANNTTFFVRKNPFYVEHETRVILEEVSVEDPMKTNRYSVFQVMA